MSYDAFRAAELEGWDARAESYNDATARATVQSVPDLLAAARLWSGARLLDACCGPGYAAGAAAALGVEAQGIDFAPSMVRAAQARFPDVDFGVGDAENLSASDASFDLVVCNFGIVHVTDPERVVREAFRVLRPGGRYAFSQWCAPEESAVFRVVFDALRAHADLEKADPAPDGFALADRGKAREILFEAGYEEIELRVVPGILRAPASEFFDFFMRLSVRTPLILARQSASVRQAVRDQIENRIREYEVAGEIRAPMLSLIVAGTKPASNS